MRHFSLFRIFVRRLCCCHSSKRYLFTSRHPRVIYGEVRNFLYPFPFSNFSTYVPVTATSPLTRETNIELNTISELLTGNDFDQIVFHPVFTDCSRKLRDFDDDAILKLCHLLGQIHVKFGSVLYNDDDILRSIARKIDKELCRRCPSVSDAGLLLQFLQAFIYLPEQKEYDFGFHVIKSLLKKILKLPTPMMLKFVRLINEMNMWRVYHINPYLIQFAILHNLPYLGINDLAHLIRATVELRNRVNTPDLFEKIFDVFVREFFSATVDTVNIFVVFFDWHAHKFHSDEGKVHLSKLLTLLHPMMDSLSLPDLTSIASLFTNSYCYDQVFFEKFAFRFTSELNESMMMKGHFLKGVDVLTTFNINIDSVDLYSRLFTELKAEPMTILHNKPKKVVTVVNYLSRLGIYDYDLLDIVFSRGFLLDTYKKLIPLAIPFQVFTLNESVSLDCPDYRGRKMPENLRQAYLGYRKSLEQRALSRNSSVDENSDHSSVRKYYHERLIFDIRTTLAPLLGGFEYVYMCYPLPYISDCNMVFCLKDGVPQVLGADVELLSGDPKQCTWYSFVFYRRNNIPSSHELLLMFNCAMEKRHMEKLGYRTLPIVTRDWKNFNSEQKKSYLKKLIFGE